MKKIVKLIKILFNIILFLIITLLAGVLIMPFFGLNLLTIVSGSMEPEYPVGCLILVDEVNAEEIKVNDVISFKINKTSDTYITHRVVNINKDEQTFTTKGDNNVDNDPKPVSFNNLLGKVIMAVPLIGYLSYYISLPAGKIIGITIIIAILILIYLLEKLAEDNK